MAPATHIHVSPLLSFWAWALAASGIVLLVHAWMKLYEVDRALFSIFVTVACFCTLHGALVWWVVLEGGDQVAFWVRRHAGGAGCAPVARFVSWTVPLLTAAFVASCCVLLSASEYHNGAVLRRLPLLLRRESTSGAITAGVLPNNFSYSLLQKPHAKRGRLSIALRVHAGSCDEIESERGIAHFAEHMSFDSTHHMPGRYEVWGWLDASGASTNAFTTRRATVYQITDVPSDDLEGVAKMMRVLREMFLDSFAQQVRGRRVGVGGGVAGEMRRKWVERRRRKGRRGEGLPHERRIVLLLFVPGISV